MSDVSDDESVVLPSTEIKHFSEYEINSLIELVNQRKSIIESKKTDCGSKNKKNNAWIKIAEEFNCDENVKKRTFKQLKKKWENLKTRAKKDIGNQVRKRRQTGGGSEPAPIPSMSEKIQTIVPSQMVGLQNDFDCDNGMLQSETEGNVVEMHGNGSISENSVEAQAQKSVAEMIVGRSNSDSGIKAPRVKKDPRSALTTWEYEEHQVRMKTLLITQEIEKERLHQTRLKTIQDTEESDLRKQLIKTQIPVFNPSHRAF